MSLLARAAAWFVPWALDNHRQVAAIVRREVEVRAMAKAEKEGRAVKIEDFSWRDEE
ncbi:MAG TPA: hypothetical protein VMZ50_05360 [Phycisphaerae bacterium]|nr:hypothetical protein [Phycisphaerae bacterium]